MSQWCRSALCGHPLPALTDNWTHGAASRHVIAPTTQSMSGGNVFMRIFVPNANFQFLDFLTLKVSKIGIQDHSESLKLLPIARAYAISYE